MSKPRPTIASLDTRICVIEKEQTRQAVELASQTGKLDTLLDLSHEHNRMCRARLSARAKVITALCSAIAAVVTAIVATLAGCG